MKSAMKTIAVFFLLCSFILPMTATAVTTVPYVDKSVFSYIIMGLDDAAENTDSIIVLSYDTKDNTLNFLHIPRDTYCTEFKGKKINAAYKTFSLKSVSSNIALEKTSDFFTELLGFDFDGAAALNSKALVNFIDSIGGVTVFLPDDIKSAGLKKGKNLLDGQTAEMFIRHRHGYKLGDLSRIEAQKIFIFGLYDTLMHRVAYTDMIKSFSALKEDFSSNFSFLDFVLLISKHGSKFKDADLNFATLPGKAVLYKGVSYFVANKSSAQELIRIFSSSKTAYFDKKYVLINKENIEFLKIYNSNKISYNILNSKEINNIKLR